MSIGSFSALFVSKPLIKMFGRLSTVLLMHLVLASALIIFGIVKNSSSDFVFISFSIISRLCEGLANSCIISTLMISAYYTDNASFLNAETFGILVS